jgi:hypothetical protein
MILVDYNQFVLTNLFVSIGNHHNAEISEDMIRHMFLNSIRRCRKKFFSEYGELVICADGKMSWRKDFFPYYKANRKKSREESEIDWSEVYRIMHKILEEMETFFPYKVLFFDTLEADDIIGTICHNYGSEMNIGEKILILSGDKDFTQLQRYRNVSQYDQVRDKFLVHSNPDEYLLEHILKGDTGDGIPNILSEDNCLVVGKRQKPMTSKRLENFKTNPDSMEEIDKLRFERNRTLIDLNFVPDKYKTMILEKFKQEKDTGRKHLFTFFTEKRLKNLLGEIGEF